MVTREIELEKGLERLGWLMDDHFRVPVLGGRIGLDAIVGLIPGFGDTATSAVSFYILASAVRYRVPKITLLRMGLNLGIDYVLGSVVDIKSEEHRTDAQARHRFSRRSS